MDDSHNSQDLTPTGVLFPKRIKTFVMRAGRTTSGQTRALQVLGPQFVIPFQREKLLNWEEIYSSERANLPIIFEIGFGMGDASAQIASQQPLINYLGCEVHEPGVGALLKKIEELDLENIRIISHDAVEVMEEMIADDSLTGIHIFFPDPWHKSRHHKRRLIQPPLVELLVKKLKVGGYIHCATDWEPYSKQILSTLEGASQLVNQSSLENGFCERPDYRPVTKFERRGLKLGHGVWDLIFKKSIDVIN
jgi:tRNA (guanine-N7-)-methyltransferase